MQARDIDPIIAVRKMRFVTGDAASEIWVELGAPRTNVDGSDDWHCPWRIVGLGEPLFHRTHGIDAFQALQLALPMIGATLLEVVDRHGATVRWLDDEHPADIGFPE